MKYVVAFHKDNCTCVLYRDGEPVLLVPSGAVGFGSDRVIAAMARVAGDLMVAETQPPATAFCDPDTVEPEDKG